MKTKRMNKEVKWLWVKALRSGKYKQTHEVLADKKGYCCLGVLTDLYLKQAKPIKIGWDHNLDYVCVPSKSDSLLPDCVQKWAGTTDDPSVVVKDIDGDDETTSLAVCNDGSDGTIRRHNFKQIADLIEKQL